MIRARQLDAYEFIAPAPPLAELHWLEQDWKESKTQYAAWRKTLADRVKLAAADARSLAEQQTQWEATLNQIQDNPAIESVVDRIRNSLNEIQTTRSKVQEQLTFLINVQHRVSQQDQVVTDVLEKINETKLKLQRSLLERDGPPLWALLAASSRGQSDLVNDASLRRSLRGALMRGQEFLKSRRRVILAIFAVFLGALAINLLFRHRLLDRTRDDTELDRTAHLFQHPGFAGIALCLDSGPALEFRCAGVDQECISYAFFRAGLAVFTPSDSSRHAPSLVSAADLRPCGWYFGNAWSIAGPKACSPGGFVSCYSRRVRLADCPAGSV